MLLEKESEEMRDLVISESKNSRSHHTKGEQQAVCFLYDQIRVVKMEVITCVMK